MTKEQFLKDLEFIKWQVENKDRDIVLHTIKIIEKRYGGGVLLPDVVDPGQENICLGCE